LIACLLGAGLGTFIACSVNLKFFWAGILAGGLIGYLSYDFKEIYEACRSAFKKVFGWRPNWKNIQLIIKLSWWFSFQLCSWLVPFVLIMKYFPDVDGNRITAIIFLVIVLALACGIWLSIAILYEKVDDKKVYYRERRALIYMSSVVIIPTIIFYHIPITFSRGVVKTPQALRAIGQFFVLCGSFVKFVFVLIHSERRLLCGVDALIGALIGFLMFKFYGLNLPASVGVGAASGGFIGFINYEIVSKRWLKDVLLEYEIASKRWLKNK